MYPLGVVMSKKSASSQAAWAILTEGVTRARVESHRLQHLINRAQKLVDGSEQKDHLYQIAGDIIVALPERLDQILLALDRTSLALAKMGEEFLESRLPLSDKTMVDEAVSAAFGKAQIRTQARKLAMRYLEDQGETEE